MRALITLLAVLVFSLWLAHDGLAQQNASVSGGAVVGAKLSWGYDVDDSTPELEPFEGWFIVQHRINDESWSTKETNNTEFWLRFAEPLSIGDEVCVQVQAARGGDRSEFSEMSCLTVESEGDRGVLLPAPVSLIIEPITE